MITLQLILDDLLTAADTSKARYISDLTRSLIATAPAGCQVAAVVAGHPAEIISKLEAHYPGLSETVRLPISSAQLSLAWQHGLPPKLVEGGLVHAPTTLAPLHAPRHEAPQQTVVTVHDTALWTATSPLNKTKLRQYRARIARIEKYADAVVVTSQATADILASHTRLGERIRVIPSAASPSLIAEGNTSAKARELDLPKKYLLVVCPPTPQAIQQLTEALAESASTLPVVVLGADQTESATQWHSRLTFMPPQTDESLAVIVARAQAVLYLHEYDGSVLSVMDIMSTGTPLIYPDSCQLRELTGDSGLIFGHEPDQQPLSHALDALNQDPELGKQIGIAHQDRAKNFDWHDTAERIWQLHADL